MQEVDDLARKETNAQPKWAVPVEVIEWQPAYTQGEWDAMWWVGWGIGMGTIGVVIWMDG